MTRSILDRQQIGLPVQPLFRNLLEPHDEDFLQSLCDRLMQPRDIARQRQRIERERGVQEFKQWLYAAEETDV